MAALLLDGPLEIQSYSGRVSSACLHPTKDLVVSVHDEGDFWNVVHCTIFDVNRQAVNLTVAQPEVSNTGKCPSITLVYLEESDKTVAIATYRSVFSKNFYYRIGFIDNISRGIKKINWQNERLFDRGVKPKVSASKNGGVALIYEEPFSFEGLKFCLGKLNTTLAVPSIDWTTITEIVDFNGVEPDVAINDTTVVVICRTGLQTLQIKVGTIESNREIRWGSTQQLPSSGINPTISINNKGYIVEIHQTKMFRNLTRNCGRILPHNRTIEWSRSSTYTQGEYPTVSLNDDNFVFEMHKSNFGLKLFYSQGELHTTEGQQVVE